MSFGKFKDDKNGSDKNSGDSVRNLLTSSSGQAVGAVLGKGAKIIGALYFEAGVQINCEIEGELYAQGELQIGESAVIKAKIEGADIQIRGTVEGNIMATRRISLLRPARVLGNISAPSLHIEEGVVFEGSCSMRSAVAAAEAGAADKAVNTTAKKDETSKSGRSSVTSASV